MPEPEKNRFYIPELDGLRFFSFILIFIHHMPIPQMTFMKIIHDMGWIGVEIFFVLSAFLITRILVLEYESSGRIHIRNFFIRRALRIWPLYFGYCFLMFIIFGFDKILNTDLIIRAIGLLTFTDNIFTGLEGFNSILYTGHLWTISFEEQFYFFIPFFTLFILKFKKTTQNKILAIILIISFVCRILFTAIFAIEFIWFIPITHFEPILIGIYLGLNYSNFKPTWVIILPLLISSIAIIYPLQTFYTNSNLELIKYPLLGIATGCAIIITLFNKTLIIKKAFTNRTVVYLGKISFGLYVFHILCINTAMYLLGWKPELWWSSAMFSLALTVAVSAASYHIFEKYFIHMKEEYMTVKSH